MTKYGKNYQEQLSENSEAKQELLQQKLDRSSDTPISIQFDNMRYGDLVRDVLVRHDLPSSENIVNAINEAIYRAKFKIVF